MVILGVCEKSLDIGKEVAPFKQKNVTCLAMLNKLNSWFIFSLNQVKKYSLKALNSFEIIHLITFADASFDYVR